MRILVTGGLGFIGKHLVRRLLRDYNIEFIDIIDNLSNSQKKGHEDILENINIKFIQQSVSNNTLEKDYDWIFHLASPVGPAGVLNYAGIMGKIIVDDVVKIAQLAIKGNSKLLCISTSEVYGKDPGDIPQREDIDKIVPGKITVRLEYGVAKLLSEIALLNLAKVSNLKVNIVRPFNIVGVGQKGEVGFVVPRFVEAALVGDSLTIFGDGSQKRTFTSVDDIIDGVLLIMNSGLYGEIYNIGNPKNLCSIQELADLIINMSGSKSGVQYVDSKVIYGQLYEEAWNKIPDVTKISALGWVPKKSIRDILSEVINSYKETDCV